MLSKTVRFRGRGFQAGDPMAQYDCALCHLPTPSPLLLLSHLEVSTGQTYSQVLTIPIFSSLSLMLTRPAMGSDSAPTWVRGRWRWSTSLPSSPPSAPSSPSTGLSCSAGPAPHVSDQTRSCVGERRWSGKWKTSSCHTQVEHSPDFQ